MSKHPWSAARVGITVIALIVVGLLVIGLYELVINGTISPAIVLGLVLTVPVVFLSNWARKKGILPPNDFTSFSKELGAVVGGKKSVPSHITLASPWRRLVAVLIDRFVALGFIMIGVVPVAALQEAAPETFGIGVGAWSVGGVMLFIYFIICLTGGACYLFARDVVRGKSIGRRLLRLQVVQEDGVTPVKWWRAIVRDLPLRFAPLPLVELILIFTDKEHRRLGDRWMKTLVISTKE